MQYVSRSHHYIGNRRQENNGLGRIGVSGQISRGHPRQLGQKCELHPMLKSKDGPAARPAFVAVPSAYQQARIPGSRTTASTSWASEPTNRTTFRCAIIGPLHRGRTHLDELCQKPVVPAVSPRVAAPLTSRIWQSLHQSVPTIDQQSSPSNLPTTPSSITRCPGASQTRHLPGRPFRPASSCRPRPNNPRPDPGQQEL